MGASTSPSTLQPPKPAGVPTPDSYEEVLYPGYSFTMSHPDRLAAQAILFGMTPAPLATCRVLELGCGDGANLIPVAFGLPQSRCLGIDLAARPIAAGQALIEATNLKNITLRQMNMLDVTPALGEFDYIIAHGIYSWVPPIVRDKLLAVCSENLAPNGVAYVSYNAYPGSHIRQMIRRMMLYHAGNVSDPVERVQTGMGLIQGLLESAKEPDVIIPILKPEFERMRKVAPEALFHDDFAEYNDPVYFYEFMDQAGRHGLKYLAEADLAAMHVTHAALIDGDALDEKQDVVACEQILDFRVLRNFRATLLCHQEAHTLRTPRLENLRRLYISAQVKADAASADQGEKGVTFRKVDPRLSLKVTTNHPLTKAALRYLGARWPERVPFDELSSAAFAESGWTPAEGELMPLENMILKMHIGKIADLSAHQTAAVAAVSERPVASALARTLLRERDYAPSLNHNNLQVDAVLGALIQLLDGTRDRAALRKELKERFAREKAAAAAEEPAKDAVETGKTEVDDLEENLNKVVRMALLVG